MGRNIASSAATGKGGLDAGSIVMMVTNHPGWGLTILLARCAIDLATALVLHLVEPRPNQDGPYGQDLDPGPWHSTEESRGTRRTR